MDPSGIFAQVATVNWKITCSNDMIVSPPQGKCGGIVNYYAPKVAGASDVTVKLSDGLASGSFFPSGSTINTFVATDKAGNTQNCSFTVRVTDNQPPILQCPADTTIRLKAGESGIKYNYVQPIATDNCSVKSVLLVEGLRSGALFPAGINKITYSAQDYAGNVASRTFYVKVLIDTVPIKAITVLAPPVKAPPVEIAPVKAPPVEVAPVKATPAEIVQVKALPVVDTPIKTTPFESPPAKTPVIEVEAPQNIPTKLSVATTGFNDNINYEHHIQAPAAPGCKFTIFVFDNEDEDGDSISIIFNDKVIIDRKMLHVTNNYSYSQAMKAVLELEPGKPNVLISKAWNVGTAPPNTCEIDIYQGELTSNMRDANKDKLVKRLILNSLPGLAAGITLQCH